MTKREIIYQGTCYII